MMQLTARPRASETREEAWKAWESARLAVMGKEWVARQRPHLKNFNKAMNSTRRWWLFAFETLPNSGVVVLQRLDGSKERVNILRPLVEMPNMAGRYAISPEYPEIAETQRELLSSGKTEIKLWELLGVAEPSKSPPTIRIFYHRGDRELPVEYRDHFRNYRRTVDMRKFPLGIVVSLVDPDSTADLVQWCPLPGTELYSRYDSDYSATRHSDGVLFGVQGLKPEHIHAHVLGK